MGTWGPQRLQQQCLVCPSYAAVRGMLFRPYNHDNRYGQLHNCGNPPHCSCCLSACLTLGRRRHPPHCHCHVRDRLPHRAGCRHTPPCQTCPSRQLHPVGCCAVQLSGCLLSRCPAQQTASPCGRPAGSSPGICAVLRHVPADSLTLWAAALSSSVAACCPDAQHSRQPHLAGGLLEAVLSICVVQRDGPDAAQVVQVAAQLCVLPALLRALRLGPQLLRL